MASTTSIEWAANADGAKGATWNPVRARNRETGAVGTHCVHASDGCRNCYAETFNLRGLPGAGTGLAYTKPNQARVDIFLDEKTLTAPLRRRKPTTFFLSSMTDVFADFVPDVMLDRLFAMMALSPRHTFIVLTKRAERMREYFTAPNGPPRRRGRLNHPWERIEGAAFDWLDANGGGRSPAEDWIAGGGVRVPLPNVWLVVSVEDQANIGRLIDLANTPAAVRGMSYEPALGPLVVDRRCMVGDETYWDFLRGVTGATLQHVALKPHSTPRLDWVICGGESGPKARPMHPGWARSLRDQCAAAGVPFFFKQWGEWAPKPDDYADSAQSLPLRIYGPNGWTDNGSVAGEWLARLGKARAGRLLDGVEHNARPPIHEVEGRKGEALATRSASPGRPAQ